MNLEKMKVGETLSTAELKTGDYNKIEKELEKIQVRLHIKVFAPLANGGEEGLNKKISTMIKSITKIKKSLRMKKP